MLGYLPLRAGFVAVLSIASASANTITEEGLAAMNEDGNANKCYFAIFTGARGENAGGVYKISPSWYTEHTGGSYASTTNGCGSIITNWIGISGSHGSHKTAVDNQEDIMRSGDVKATFEGKLADPLSTEPPTTSTEAPTAAATFNVAATCADSDNYKKLSFNDGDGTMIFCSRYHASDEEYEFNFLLKPGNTWGGVGLNFKGSGMADTEIMWIGLQNDLPVVKYRKATGQVRPAEIAAGSQPDAEVENTAAGVQAKWRRPLVVDGFTTLTNDTSGATIIAAWATGALTSGFSKHTQSTEQFKGENLAVAGLSGKSSSTKIATYGNLAHGAMMILAWLCLSPTATIWMKYGKHLNIGGKPPIWFKVHQYSQTLAIIVTIIGLILIVQSGVELGELEEDSETHAKYGLAVIGLCIFQGLLGYARKQISGDKGEDNPKGYHHGPNRFIFNFLHRTNGWVLFFLSMITVRLGIKLFEDSITKDTPDAWLQDPADNLSFIFLIVSIVVIAVLELVHITKYNWGTAGPFNCTGADDFTDESKAEDEWEMKLRSILISLYTAFSIATAISLFVIIADTDADEFKRPEY